MVLQTQAQVPARWRFLFAAALPLVFFAALLFVSRPGPTPDQNTSAPAAEQEMRNARIRLQTAALAFAPGKLDPGVAVVTDRPEVYAPPAPAELFDDELTAALANFEVPKYWGRMIVEANW